MQLYGIFGAGGLAREIMPVAKSMLSRMHSKEDIELVFVLENTSEIETLINGYRVMSEADFMAHNECPKYFNIAINDYKVRERIAEKMAHVRIQPFTITADNVVLLDHNQIGEGAIFCPFSTVTSNARIGRFFHSNIYSYVAHDCVIGNFVTFAPNVHCNGSVVIEDYAYIGAGAIIKQGTPDKPIIVGKGAVVGMGAVVTKSVAPFAVVVGNPATELKR